MRNRFFGNMLFTAIVVTVVLSFAACGNNNASENSNKSSSQAALLQSDAENSAKSDVQNSEESNEISDTAKVDERLRKLLQSDDYKKAAFQNQCEAVETLLNTLISEGLVTDGSVSYNASQKMFSFQYKSGASGSVVMKSFSDKINNTTD